MNNNNNNNNKRKFSLSNRIFLFVDIFLIIGSYFISYFLRFYPELIKNKSFIRISDIFVQISIYLLIFTILNIYKIIWAYSNIKDVYRLALGNFLAAIVYFVFLFFYHKTTSRLMVLIDFFFILCGTIFIRAIYRDYFSRRNGGFKKSKDRENKKILIIGAGEAGRNLIGEIIKRGEEDTVVGFLDEDPLKKGKILNGKRIFGDLTRLKKEIDDKGVNEIYIAIPSATSEQLSRITETIRKVYPDIPIKIIPSFLEITSNIPLLHTLRDVSIEDLLGREEFSIDIKSISELFNGKRILITGAGGSIGSEICRQLLKYNVAQLIAIGRGEYSIYNLIKELEGFKQKNNLNHDIVYKIVNIKNLALLDAIFEEYRPDIVFHAAAHKHVPLMEFNESEAIHNNIYGTKYVLDLSVKYKIKKFILVSTDKAVNPVNIMGATKRAAEILALYYNNLYNLKTTIVRFGNVIGSRGSVIPLFIEQIQSGGPITITHPDIVRYFMTIPEAATLMLNAAAYSNGGDIFVLDMGKQYKIVDIAYNLIKFFGLEPEKDIKIEYTGLRPGEKLYEELFFKKEQMLATLNEKILQINPKDISFNKNSIDKILSTNPNELFTKTRKEIRQWISEVVPEYLPEEINNDNCKNRKLIS